MAAEIKKLPDEQLRFYAPLISRVGRDKVTVEAVDGKGKGLKAVSAFKAGEMLFMEEPLVSHQFFANREVVQICGHCHKFIGTLQSQLNKLMTVTIAPHEAAGIESDEVRTLQQAYNKSFPALPAGLTLPNLEKEAAVLTPVVPCPFGCAEEFCSNECRDKAVRQYHMLLCTAFDETKASEAKEKGILSAHNHESGGCDHDHDHDLDHHHHEGAESESDGDDGPAEDADINAAALFSHQALAANEMLLFAGKVVGRVIEAWVKNGNNLDEALRPFTVLHSAPWWTLFALREVAEEEKAKAEAELDAEDDEISSADDVPGSLPSGAGAGTAESASLDEKSEWARDMKSELQEYLLDSLIILRSLVGSRAPHIIKHIRKTCKVAPSAEPLESLREWESDALFDPGMYERLIAALELNSIEVKIDSPLREYVDMLRRLPRESSGKVTSLYDQAAAVVVPALGQMRAARLARKAKTRILEAALAVANGEEPEEEEEEEDDEDDDDDDEGDDGPPSFISDQDLERLFPMADGSAVFALISCMNHHCEPNVQASYVSGTRDAALVAIRNIDPSEEININYVDIMQPARMRRADLKHYGFHCLCHRCMHEDTAAAAKASLVSSALP